VGAVHETDIRPGSARGAVCGTRGRVPGMIAVTIEEFWPLGDFRSLIDAKESQWRSFVPPGLNPATLSNVIFGVPAPMCQIHALRTCIIHRD
jgi:hypothetical protein